MKEVSSFPTTKVDSIVSASNSIGVDALGNSFASLFSQANGFSKLIIVALVLISICSWAVIIQKYFIFFSQRLGIKRTEEILKNKSFSDFSKSKKISNSECITVKILVTAMNVVTSSEFTHKKDISEILMRLGHIEISKFVSIMNSRLSFLAFAASNAPFIGLLGTVWGIITSFQSISINKAINLIAIAPGIAEALMATALGLIVAIPASVFYNKFKNDIEFFSSAAEIVLMESIVDAEKVMRLGDKADYKQ
ncbi:MAG: MotA/TolQ/ExbB proton channel family protein [Proteobacteria bacterium]|nr:MotA/TolQ/ExbB proton channel family protein [Pseudomonadota bacterium]